MYKLALIVNEVYKEGLKLAEESGKEIDLEFFDPGQRIKDRDRVFLALSGAVEAAVKRAKKHISVKVRKTFISVTDDGRVLPVSELEKISDEELGVTVRSRVGVGTEVTIRL